MKRLTGLALLVAAIGAIVHFWPEDDRHSAAPSASFSASSRDPPAARAGNSTPAHQPSAASALSPERAARPATVERTSVNPVQLDVRAPATVRSGDTFEVTIDAQAPRGMRQLTFSVTYKKAIVELVGSSPGAFAQQGGASAHFEEVSDGHVIVRIDVESGVIAGAGSVAVLEFRALRRGGSPLSVHSVTYVEHGSQDTTAAPTSHDGSITVE